MKKTSLCLYLFLPPAILFVLKPYLQNELFKGLEELVHCPYARQIVILVPFIFFTIIFPYYIAGIIGKYIRTAKIQKRKGLFVLGYIANFYAIVTYQINLKNQIYDPGSVEVFLIILAISSFLLYLFFKVAEKKYIVKTEENE